jgi:dethiobiotin synthetase
VSIALFVTGTDTGVGKTAVSTALLVAFARRGLRVAALKPCETGDGDDAQRLAWACGRPLDPSLVSPFRFPMPASPEAAAAAAGEHIEFARIRECFDTLRADSDLLLVEGAGGLLVPAGNGQLIADWIRALATPLLIVARPSLGTVNHTLLTIDAAGRRDLPILGVLFSKTSDHEGPDEPSNPASIARHGHVSIFGTLPRLPPSIFSDRDALARAAEQHLSIDRLLESLG